MGFFKEALPFKDVIFSISSQSQISILPVLSPVMTHTILYGYISVFTRVMQESRDLQKWDV